MLAIHENPPMLASGVKLLSELEGKWWVAHTKSRFEKAFAWDLAELGIGYFLPMNQRTTFSGGRKRQVMSPLFSSYVFFCGGEDAHSQAMRTNRLCQVIAVREQGKLLLELEQIHRVLMSGLALETYGALAIGTRCRVRAGPLKDVVGIVVGRAKLARLVLKVTMLGQGTCVEIDGDLLEVDEATQVAA